VLDDAGIAILPLYLALDPVIAKRLVPILPGWQPKSVVPCALYSVLSFDPQGQGFLDFIQKYLGTIAPPKTSVIL
jgi:DNA-binding transcriptional LysR family regulator